MLTPREDQERSIGHLISCLKTGQAALDGSDTGVGKTLVAVETIRRWDQPTLVVAPKAVLPGWVRTGKSQGVELDALNYEKLRTGRTPYGEWKLPSPRHRKERFVWHPGIKRLIFDEVQRCQGRDSKNSELLRAARRQGIPTLALSATPGEDPLDLDALGYVLRLHDGTDGPTLNNPDPLSFWSWARRHGCGPGAFSQFIFAGSAESKIKHMARINAAIFPAKGVRVRRTDVPGFPESQIAAELYDLEDGGRINELYAEMDSALQALQQVIDANPFSQTHPLTKILRARQEVELLKVPVFVELAQEAVSAGMSVAIFVNFRQTLAEICARLGTDCFIDGSQTGDSGAIRREANRLRFQSDQARVIVCIGEAGGVGLDLHDVTGKHPRLALISAGYNAKTLRQIFGRVWRSGALSKSLQRVIFAASTREELIHGSVAGKLNNLDGLNDGDLSPQNLLITTRF